MFPNKKYIVYVPPPEATAINSILYGGANVVPIAVPRICFKNFFTKSKDIVLYHSFCKFN